MLLVPLVMAVSTWAADGLPPSGLPGVARVEAATDDEPAWGAALSTQTVSVGDVVVEVELPTARSVGHIVPVTLRAQGGSGVVEVEACLDVGCDIVETTTLPVSPNQGGPAVTVFAGSEAGRFTLKLRRGAADAYCCAVSTGPPATSVFVIAAEPNPERTLRHEYHGPIRVLWRPSLGEVNTDGTPNVLVLPRVDAVAADDNDERARQREALWESAADGTVVVVGDEPEALGVARADTTPAQRRNPNPDAAPADVDDPRAVRVSVGAGQLVFAPGLNASDLTDLAIAQMGPAVRNTGARILPAVARVAAVGVSKRPSVALFGGVAFAVAVGAALFFAQQRRRSLAVAVGGTFVVGVVGLVGASTLGALGQDAQTARVTFWSIPDDRGVVIAATATAAHAGRGVVVEVPAPSPLQLVARYGIAEHSGPLTVQRTERALRATLQPHQVVVTAGLAPAQPTTRVRSMDGGVAVTGGPLLLRAAVRLGGGAVEVGSAANPSTSIRFGEALSPWDLAERLVQEERLSAFEAAALVEAIGACATRHCTMALLVDPGAAGSLVVAAVPQ